MEPVFVSVRRYEGFYEVGNNGVVRSLPRTEMILDSSRTRCGRELKPHLARGYYRVTLYKKGDTEQFQISRLVAEHFVPNPKNKSFVNHKDGNKLNNTFENLEWVPGAENMQHASVNGLLNPNRGESNYNSKLTEVDVKEIFESGESGYRLAEKYGVCEATISMIRSGKRWKHVTSFPVEDYQEWTTTTAIYPKNKEREYLFTATASEVGELCGKYQKYLRDKMSEAELKDSVKDESGDILWNLSQLFNHFGLTFDEVMLWNRDKLTSRMERHTLMGSGDSR